MPRSTGRSPTRRSTCLISRGRALTSQRCGPRSTGWVGPRPDPMAPRVRPFVVVNCAVSADGRLAYAGGRRARLSGPRDLAPVQALPAEVGAILVGARTLI